MKRKKLFKFKDSLHFDVEIMKISRVYVLHFVDAWNVLSLFLCHSIFRFSLPLSRPFAEFTMILSSPFSNSVAAAWNSFQQRHGPFRRLLCLSLFAVFPLFWVDIFLYSVYHNFIAINSCLHFMNHVRRALWFTFILPFHTLMHTTLTRYEHLSAAAAAMS